MFVCLFTKLLNRTECPVFFFLPVCSKENLVSFVSLAIFREKKIVFIKKKNKGEKMSAYIFKLDSTTIAYE